MWALVFFSFLLLGKPLYERFEVYPREEQSAAIRGAHKVHVGEEERYFTRAEWLLLTEFAGNIGRLMVYEDLLTRIWGPEYRNDIQILRTWISRLRSKLETDPNSPSLIRTIPKTGYIMDWPSDG